MLYLHCLICCHHHVRLFQLGLFYLFMIDVQTSMHLVCKVNKSTKSGVLCNLWKELRFEMLIMKNAGFGSGETY